MDGLMDNIHKWTLRLLQTTTLLDTFQTRPLDDKCTPAAHSRFTDVYTIQALMKQMFRGKS